MIKSPFIPANQRASRSHRTDGIFNRLAKWLHNHGINSHKPIRTLRKEVGSIIADHIFSSKPPVDVSGTDIRITAAFYADKKQKVVPKLNQS